MPEFIELFASDPDPNKSMTVVSNADLNEQGLHDKFPLPGFDILPLLKLENVYFMDPHIEDNAFYCVDILYREYSEYKDLVDAGFITAIHVYPTGSKTKNITWAEVFINLSQEMGEKWGMWMPTELQAIANLGALCENDGNFILRFRCRTWETTKTSPADVSSFLLERELNGERSKAEDAAIARNEMLGKQLKQIERSN